MAPVPSDDATQPRRSRRATVALIASFIIATLMTIIGHLDRIPDLPADADAPGPGSSVGRLALAARPQSATVGVAVGVGVGIDVGIDVETRAGPEADTGDRSTPPTSLATATGRVTLAALDDRVTGVVVPGSVTARTGEDVNVHLIAPVAWKQALAPGSAFQFHVDQTGRNHHGRVLRLDEGSDPARRTLRVVGALSDDQAAPLPGMSGSARFDRRAGATRR